MSGRLAKQKFEVMDEVWHPKKNEQYSWVEMKGGPRVMTGYWDSDKYDIARRKSKNMYPSREFAYLALVEKLHRALDRIRFTLADLQ